MQSPAPSFLQKHDEGIAPSLSQGYVVLEILSVLWATPTPLQTHWNFGLPYIHQLLFAHSIRKGLPCYPTWLPLRVTPATPGVHPPFMAVFFRIRCSSLPLLTTGSATPSLSHEATYRFAFAATRRFARLTYMSLCQRTQRFRLPLTPPSSYMGELPNSHGRTLTDKSCVLHGIRSSLRLTYVIQ